MAKKSEMPSLPVTTRIRDLRFALDQHQSLLFTDDVITHLQKYRQYGNRREAGGQLFARFGSNEITLVRATGPRISDRRSQVTYVPNRRAERREIKRLFKDGLHYVGDWHTHMQSIPSPSPTDLSSMIDMFIKSEHSLAGFVIVIVGTSEPPSGFYVAVCNGFKCTELHPVSS